MARVVREPRYQEETSSNPRPPRPCPRWRHRRLSLFQETPVVDVRKPSSSRAQQKR